VPTGIVTAEMSAIRSPSTVPTTRTCHECLTEGHLAEALFCLHCGARLPAYLREHGAPIEKSLP
jgi:voltage-gated potassium channel